MPIGSEIPSYGKDGQTPPPPFQRFEPSLEVAGYLVFSLFKENNSFMYSVMSLFDVQQ